MRASHVSLFQPPLEVAQMRALSARFGQPHHLTHPHLIKSHEVVFGISKAEFAVRRQNLIDKLPPGSIAIIPSGVKQYMSNDIPFLFKQNVNFLYLSGFQEPSSVMVLEKTADSRAHFTMYCQGRDPHTELWDGSSTGVERACDFLGADDAHKVDKFESFLEHVNPNTPVYYSSIDSTNQIEKSITQRLKVHKLEPLTTKIEELRLIKSDAEMENMRHAGKMSGEAFAEAMKQTVPGSTEGFINALIDFECQKRGSKRLAYPPVVATGKNAITLHYIMNDDVLRKDDLLLVDAGGDFHDYVADITRTWPVSGKFTGPQLEIYSAVLEIQTRCIAVARQGASLNLIHQYAKELVTHALKSLGLGSLNPNEVFPHSIGHWLGMDVHDTANISQSLPLQPGMIVTMEPGLYFPDHPSVPSWYRNIGVRIEDDILIGKDGQPEVLTAAAPKEVAHIQALMGQK